MRVLCEVVNQVVQSFHVSVNRDEVALFLIESQDAVFTDLAHDV